MYIWNFLKPKFIFYFQAFTIQDDDLVLNIIILNLKTSVMNSTHKWSKLIEILTTNRFLTNKILKNYSNNVYMSSYLWKDYICDVTIIAKQYILGYAQDLNFFKIFNKIARCKLWYINT